MDTTQVNNMILGSRNFTLGTWTRSLVNSTALAFTDLLATGSMLSVLIWQSRIHGASHQSAALIYTLLAALAVLLFLSRGHYHKRIPFWDECKDTLKVMISLGLAQGAVGVIFAPEAPSAPYIFAWFANVFIVLLARTLMKGALIRFGSWQLPTVIIGDGLNAVETAKAITEERLLGYDIIAFLSTNGQTSPQIEIGGKSIPVKPIGMQPEKFLRRLNSPHIIVALEKGGLNEIQHYFDRLSLRYSQISIVPALRGLPLFGTDYYNFFSHEVLMLNLRNNLSKSTSRITKRLFDFFGALSILLVLLPLFAVVAILVRKTGRQILFGHERVGKNGKPFKCYKFRSMVTNSAEVLEELLETCPQSRSEWERDFKLKNDPRITKIGRTLRKTSLDELPQLFNVLRGEMSLVGPRPVIQEEIERYGDKAVFYYRARPGITGLWQVSGRNDIDYEARIDLDVWYVRNWSLWNDIIILIRTITVVLRRDGAY